MPDIVAGVGYSRSAQRSRLVLSAIACLVALGACGSNDDPSSGADRTQPEAGATSSRPPTREAQLEGVNQASPEAAVLTLYYSATWGAYAEVVRHYHPSIRRRITSDTIATVYSLNRSAFQTWSPRIVDVHKTGKDTLVAVELRRSGAEPSYESFLLRELDGDWVILYDTYFDRALGDYVRITVDGPSREVPTKRGAAAALSASRGFRSVFLTDDDT